MNPPHSMPSWTGSIRRGKYVEATEIAKRLLANREKGLCPEHPEVDTLRRSGPAPGTAGPGC